MYCAVQANSGRKTLNDIGHMQIDTQPMLKSVFNHMTAKNVSCLRNKNECSVQQYWKRVKMNKQHGYSQ